MIMIYPAVPRSRHGKASAIEKLCATRLAAMRPCACSGQQSFHTGHFGALGSTLSPKASWYVSSTWKQSLYLSPPSPLQLQCQLLVSVGSGTPMMPKWAFVAWQRQVLYIAQEPVAANLHALHASSLVAKAPSAACSGSVPSGAGGGCGCAVRKSVRQTAGATKQARTHARVEKRAIGGNRKGTGNYVNFDGGSWKHRSTAL